MNVKLYICTLFIFFAQIILATRSCIRSSSLHNNPIIITFNDYNDEKYYILRDSILEKYPIFNLYDLEHLKHFLLPDTAITFRTNIAQSVEGTVLKNLLENLLQEIKAKKTTYKEFFVLKGSGFNTKKQAGLLIVKCKKYPFVVKLFMENPRSFIRPYNKGFEPSCQFIVGGGITRHALGFTRIKNLNQIRKKIDSNPNLRHSIDIPRKWFWIPKHEEYFHIRGYNFEKNPITVDVPAIYAIIADSIEIERTLTHKNKSDKDFALEITKALDYTIDPHIKNFVIEKETGKTILIDTEHFPSLVGLKKKPHISSYFSYYFDLAMKYLKDRYGRLKYERINLLRKKQLPFHTLS